MHLYRPWSSIGWKQANSVTVAVQLPTDSSKTGNISPVDPCNFQLEMIKTALQCPICKDLLTQPYTLDPCGHSFDLACLQKWFCTPPPRQNEAHWASEPYPMAFCLVDRDKTCPTCRTIVYLPSPGYALKSVLSVLRPNGGGGEVVNEDYDPWMDIFYEDDDL
ncbi:hypothetical protein B0H10DRAFT_279613 [Mycena sp. CBHHK59/15]|nr:hypothetical protein B0H10DRAFT_279613 [Mycena sp. CBHHK59/15]